MSEFRKQQQRKFKDYPFFILAKQHFRTEWAYLQNDRYHGCTFLQRDKTANFVLVCVQPQIFMGVQACRERFSGSPVTADTLCADADVTNQERKSISNTSSVELKALVLHRKKKGGGGPKDKTKYSIIYSEIRDVYSAQDMKEDVKGFSSVIITSCLQHCAS